MPCNCDHMEPSKWERQSHLVAGLLVSLAAKLGTSNDLPSWVVRISQDEYGDTSRVHDLTAMMCKMCAEADQTIIYDGRDKHMRAVADWWDAHKEADKVKLAAAKKKSKLAKIRKKALAKLSDDELESLGLLQADDPDQ